MHIVALLTIICLGLVASVAHVDAGARPPSKEDMGYYDDDYNDGSIVGLIGVIIMIGLSWVIFLGLLLVIFVLIASILNLLEWLQGH